MNSRPALRPWDELDALYKNSNREQAADYVNKIETIGCEIVPARGRVPAFKFAKEELHLLAEMEHERWLGEREIIEPHHADLVPWGNLGASKKKKDFDAIKAIPVILKSVGLAVRRME